MNTKEQHGMDTLDERFLVYTAILMVCSALGALAGFTAAAATFVMIAAAVEAAYLLGGVMSAPGQFGASN